MSHAARSVCSSHSRLVGIAAKDSRESSNVAQLVRLIERLDDDAADAEVAAGAADQPAGPELAANADSSARSGEAACADGTACADDATGADGAARVVRTRRCFR